MTFKRAKNFILQWTFAGTALVLLGFLLHNYPMRLAGIIITTAPCILMTLFVFGLSMLTVFKDILEREREGNKKDVVTS